MGILEGVKRQLRSVIQWDHPDPECLFYQWSDNGDEIKRASKLIVGPGQGCIFVYQGKVRYILDKEKMISLKTDNIPFWTTISKYMQFFESEHKTAIYFYRRTKILNQKWGTHAPIKYEDPKYHFPVALKAFGNYSYQISDVKNFFYTIVGSHQNFYQQDFRQVMSDRILQPLTDFLSESQYSYTDIDANLNEIVTGMQNRLEQEFSRLGFEITDFRIEGTEFDEQTQKRINRIADLTAEAHAAKAVGMTYAGMQQVEAMRDAARNEGGGAGLGMGMGAGLGMGQVMAQNMSQQINASTTQNPTTATPTQTTENEESDMIKRLKKLKKLYQAELITEQEYEQKKQDILNEL